MLVEFFKLEDLIWFPVIGIILIVAFCLYTLLIMVYALIAECYGWPMPLDTRYFIGKVNSVIMSVLAIGGLIFYII